MIELAEDGQKALAELPFDLVPPDGLHLTLAKVGSIAEVSHERAERIWAAGRVACERLPPIELSIGPLTGSRGAVRFSVAPWAPLLSIHSRLVSATHTVLADHSQPPTGILRPHVGIAYCRDAIATDRVAALLTSSRAAPAVNIEVARIDLVLLRRDSHEYRWDPVDSIPLAT